MSSEVEIFMKRNLSNLSSQLNTSIPAKIIKIDLKYMRADVEASNGSIIMQVPISAYQTSDFVVRPPYKVGDDVLLVFSQDDIEPILFGGGDPSRRKHAIDYAFIIGGITKFTNPLSGDYEEHEEDFVISKLDFSAKIILKKNSEILIESNEDINIKSNKDINISAPNGIVTTSDSRGGG